MYQSPTTSIRQYFPLSLAENDSFTYGGKTESLSKSTFKPEKSSRTLPDVYYFDGKSLSTRDICYKLQSLPHIQSLRLTSVHDVVPVLRKICRRNKHLEKIVLKDCTSEEPKIPETVLINVLLSLPDLKAFELNNTKFKSHLFYKSVAKHSNITSIDISLNEFITLDDLMVLVHNSRLQEFKMSRRCKEPKISDLEMAHMINSMRNQLTLLHLDMSGLNNFTYSEILQCTKLIDLKLNNAMNLSADILKQLPKALIHLQHLKIEGPSLLTQKDFEASFITGGNVSNQLETLKLQHFNCLNDTECGNILEVCSNLKNLSLKGCKSLTIEGMLSHLLRLTNLTHLNIAFVGKPTRVNSVISYLPKLTKLTVDDTFYDMNQAFLANTNKNVHITQLGSSL